MLHESTKRYGGSSLWLLFILAALDCWFIYTILLPHGKHSKLPTTPKRTLADLRKVFGSSPGPASFNAATNTSRDEHPQKTKSSGLGQCDISRGKWIPDTKPPVYTNQSCKFIHPAQDCMANGRPDRQYLNWRWKPAGCELSYLDAGEFLRFMRNRKMVFVGDSIARNHMQSLLCTLAQVEESEKLYFDTSDREMRWRFTSYNFTLNYLWSPFLVQHEFIDETYHVHLDVPDKIWASPIHGYDFLVVSTGYWYFRPSIYYMSNKLLGCNPRSGLNFPTLEVPQAYELAHRNMLKHFLEGYGGVTILRTVTVDHFEHGSWNTGGLCNRTSPFSDRDSPSLPWMTHEMNTIQVREFERASKGGGAESWRLNLLNVTYSAFMRPDGHPNSYRIQEPNERPQNDCLHWCLPGPIDTWNEFLWHTLRELQRSRSRLNTKVTEGSIESEKV